MIELKRPISKKVLLMLDQETLIKLDAVATSHGISRLKVIRFAIDTFLEDIKKTKEKK